MNYIIFITINKQTNEYYIGLTTNEDLNYLGEGVQRYQASTYMYPKTLLQLAIKQYGQQNFIRCDLYKYSDKEKAIDKYLDTLAESGDNVYLPIVTDTSKYKSINQFDTEGNLIKTWNMAVDACSFYNLSIEKLNFAVSDRHLLAKSLWSYQDKIDISQYSIKPWNNALTTYLYEKDQLLRVFMTPNEVANYLNTDIKVVKDAIKNQHSINKYYITNKLVLKFIPKARRQYAKCPIYIYNRDAELVKVVKGKELLRFLKQHSWQKIQNACQNTGGWYDDYYLSFKQEPPMKRYFKIYDAVGNLLETTNDKETLITKYGLTKAQVERVIRGKKHQNNYVINYSK